MFPKQHSVVEGGESIFKNPIRLRYQSRRSLVEIKVKFLAIFRFYDIIFFKFCG